MIVMIDNYDSFTYNLVQYFGELGADVRVHRNDQITVDEVAAMKPTHIVLSPGPCTPNEAGICLELIDKLKGRFPILGVCLGHQAIGQAFGGKVVRARNVMHGKTSAIHHRGAGVFSELPTPFTATRYHSLIVERDSVPKDFEVTAWTQHAEGAVPRDSDSVIPRDSHPVIPRDFHSVVDEIMGLRHKTLPIEGVQFHPESILTEHGHDLLRNFLEKH